MDYIIYSVREIGSILIYAFHPNLNTDNFLRSILEISNEGDIRPHNHALKTGQRINTERVGNVNLKF